MIPNETFYDRRYVSIYNYTHAENMGIRYHQAVTRDLSHTTHAAKTNRPSNVVRLI